MDPDAETDSMRPDIPVELARRQHGVLSRRDLREAGVASSTLSRWAGRGLLRRMYHGVYLVGVAVTPESRWMAAVLAAGPEALLSHASAARCWGILPGPQAGTCHVTVPDRRNGRIRGIRISRSRCLQPDDRTVCRGIPVTAPARTLLDLAEHLGAGDLERALARADRKELATRRDVRRVLGRCRGKRGTGILRTLLEREGELAFTRSEAEDRFLDIVRKAGLNPPRTNAPLGSWEVDFFWPDAPLAVEIDGFGYHRSRTSFENDRQKDGWLARRGISVLRFTWRQLENSPLEIVATLSAVLGSSAPGVRDFTR